MTAQDEDGGNEEGQHIGHRHRVQNAVQPEVNRQQQGKAHAEHHLPDHGQEGGGQRLAHCLQEDEAGLVDAGQYHHGQVDAEGTQGEVRVIAALVGSAEDGDEGSGEALRQKQRHSAYGSLGDEQAGE